MGRPKTADVLRAKHRSDSENEIKKRLAGLERGWAEEQRVGSEAYWRLKTPQSAEAWLR